MLALSRSTNGIVFTFRFYWRIVHLTALKGSPEFDPQITKISQIENSCEIFEFNYQRCVGLF
jgi:hypothetical protein